jgi:hypothetical protein
MNSLGKTLFQSELTTTIPAAPLDAVEPLPCDRWLAASALQKAIRRGDALTAQRAARTLYRHDSRSAWRRLLVIAYEDIGIGAPDAMISTTLRGANANARRDAGGDEAAALATSEMLAAAPKDRSADLPFAVVLHDPTLENARSTSPSLNGWNSSRIRRYPCPSVRSPLGILRESRNRENGASAPATLAA